MTGKGELKAIGGDGSGEGIGSGLLGLCVGKKVAAWSINAPWVVRGEEGLLVAAVFIWWVGWWPLCLFGGSERASSGCMKGRTKCS